MTDATDLVINDEIYIQFNNSNPFNHNKFIITSINNGTIYLKNITTSTTVKYKTHKISFESYDKNYGFNLDEASLKYYQNTVKSHQGDIEEYQDRINKLNDDIKRLNRTFDIEKLKKSFPDQFI